MKTKLIVAHPPANAHATTAYNFRIAYIFELLDLSKEKKSALGCLSLCDAVFGCKPPCVVLCNFIHTANSTDTFPPLFLCINWSGFVLLFKEGSFISVHTVDQRNLTIASLWNLLAFFSSSVRYSLFREQRGTHAHRQPNPRCCHAAGSNRWPRLFPSTTQLREE